MKRIPDIIIEPKKQTHKGMSMIKGIPILITKNKHKIKNIDPNYNNDKRKSYI